MWFVITAMGVTQKVHGSLSSDPLMIDSRQVVVETPKKVHGSLSASDPLMIDPRQVVVETPRACPSNCSGHGRCEPIGACVCLDGYRGEACESPEPTKSCKDSCNGHGWCVRGTCLCEEFWRGGACESPAKCPNKCSGFGECMRSGKCRCDSLHTGADCSKPRPNCPGWPTACSGLEHGVCDSESATCACRPAWRGAACEISTAPRPCPRGRAVAVSVTSSILILANASEEDLEDGGDGDGDGDDGGDGGDGGEARNRTVTTCSGRGQCDHEYGWCVCDLDELGWQYEGRACERRAGQRTLLEWLTLVMAVLILLSACAVVATVAALWYLRGVRPVDALRGRWHVRKEEGWRPAEAAGALPGARFERYGFWLQA